MKKRLIIIMLALALAITCLAGLTACTTPPTEEKIEFKTLRVIDRVVYGNVSNATTSFSFDDEIEIIGNASYQLYKDSNCLTEYEDTSISLKAGDNVVYLLETTSKGLKLYTVTIHRREIYTVQFITETDQDVPSQYLEEDVDLLAQEPDIQLEKAGYDFMGWDYDFNEPITQNTTIRAVWNVKEEMSNFNFTSTSTTCTITGINDKTVSEISIPDYVTSIGSSAFYGCSSLTSVTIGDSVTSIGSEAFSSCERLTSITIPNSVRRIGESVFYTCPIEKATIPTIAIPYISKGKLTKVEIIGGDSIGSSAFLNCPNLTSITIGDSVTSIGDWAFEDCTKLASVYYTGTIDEWVQIEFANSYANPLCNGADLYVNNAKVTSATINASKINDHAFSGCTSLTSITIGDNVTSVGSYAFSNCDSLISVTIGDNVTSIGSSAFSNCDSLTSVTIPDSVISIGSYAFCGCDSLTSVTIPDNVTSIGYMAFYGCTSLASVTIGDNVISIGSKAFYACIQLKSVTIGDNVTSIGSYAFAWCNSLTSVTIGDNVTSIGSEAFYGCRQLKSVTIGDNITSIGQYAFAWCNSLTSITIPNSVTSIGSYAFAWTNLTIYCEAVSMPSGWNSGWNSENRPVYWYSTDAPTTSGKYWHYVNGVVTKWE